MVFVRVPITLMMTMILDDDGCPLLFDGGNDDDVDDDADDDVDAADADADDDDYDVFNFFVCDNDRADDHYDGWMDVGTQGVNTSVA